jgi:hypothetical protein
MDCVSLGLGIHGGWFISCVSSVFRGAHTVVTTYLGSTTGGYMDGIGSQAQFRGPSGMAFDLSSNLYITDSNNQRIRRATTSRGTHIPTCLGSILYIWCRPRLLQLREMFVVIDICDPDLCDGL